MKPVVSNSEGLTGAHSSELGLLHLLLRSLRSRQLNIGHKTSSRAGSLAK